MTHSPELHAAVRFLETLRVGDRVRVTLDTKPPTVHEVTVSRAAWRDYSYESTKVRVTYGPGRYSFNVLALDMARPGSGTRVEVIAETPPAPRSPVREIAANNARDGWAVDELDGQLVARRYTATYTDYPEPWLGFIWPVDPADPAGVWAYEVRAARTREALRPEADPVVFECGTGKLHKVFGYINSKN